jgi:hypothetical protein
MIPYCSVLLHFVVGSFLAYLVNKRLRTGGAIPLFSVCNASLHVIGYYALSENKIF